MRAKEVEEDSEEDEFEVDPVINRTQTRQQGSDGPLQLSYLGQLLGMDNRSVLGSSYDSGHTDFSQHRQDGALTGDRRVVVTGPNDLRTRLNAQNRYYGV